MTNILCKKLSTFLILLCLSTSTTALADEEYNQELADGAKDWLESQLELEANETAEIDVTPPSSRRNYPVCEGEITYELVAGKIRKNNSIRIECKSETTPFKAYATARLEIKMPYVTVVNAVPKNSVLTADNLVIDYMNKNQDRGRTFSDPAVLDGIRTKRDIRPGQPVLTNQICVICEGDEIDIEAAGSGFSVKTRGEAIQDGSFGDTIRVKNSKSGKVVKGKVVDATLVLIEM